MNDISECYRILDLEDGASLEEVKRSYRELVQSVGELPDADLEGARLLAVCSLGESGSRDMKEIDAR